MSNKFSYFRHSVTVRTNKKMAMFKDLLGRRKKEAYHYYFTLIELCSAESEDGQIDFDFHIRTVRDLWEVSESGVHEVCTAMTLSLLAECTVVASQVKCCIANLPEYLGSYSTKKERKERKKINILERSILSTLFTAEDEIQRWLLTGTDSAQKELFDKYSHHVLAEEIKKAYLWQLEKSPRKAGTFLITWMSNKKSPAFNPNQAKAAFKSKSHGVASTPENPTGNPYLEEARQKGYIA